MSICITIVANQLETVVEKLDNTKFKYKFLYDSDDKYKTIEEYNLQLLPDCLMFSGLSSQLRANRMTKTYGREFDKAWDDIINAIFKEERHIAVVNDYWDNHYMVLVIPITIYDPTQRAGNNTTTLSDEQLECLVTKLTFGFKNNEGMNVLTWEEYDTGMFKDNDPDDSYFKTKQQWIKNQALGEYKHKLYATFIEAFKFRMITYYTKLRDYGLDDIMRKLDELGYLDERFNNDLYLYEEEARRLLAKRLCAISFKNDIRLLIDEGIIKPESITYNLEV